MDEIKVGQIVEITELMGPDRLMNPSARVGDRCVITEIETSSRGPTVYTTNSGLILWREQFEIVKEQEFVVLIKADAFDRDRCLFIGQQFEVAEYVCDGLMFVTLDSGERYPMLSSQVARMEDIKGTVITFSFDVISFDPVDEWIRKKGSGELVLRYDGYIHPHDLDVGDFTEHMVMRECVVEQDLFPVIESITREITYVLK